MKKLLSFFLALALIFTIVACGSEPAAENPPDAPENVTEQPIEDHVETPSEPQEDAPPAESVPVEPTETLTPDGPVEPTPENSSFEVHFIDVGQADAALVLCDGKTMLIDGGNSEDSNLIYSYLKQRNISHLDYIISTHAHEDHVGGLSGALNYASVGTTYSPVTSYDSKAFSSFVKYLDAQNASITVPAANDSFNLGSAAVKILGPIKNYSDTNNTSIVLRIVYGDTSFLFTGDAERESEQDILSSGNILKSTVLKVGHHGSDSSTTYPFLREIMPEYAVISVGEGNSYGHPTEDTLSRLRDADVKVFRTDMQGTIICKSDGKTVSFAVERNKDADTLGLTDNSTSSPSYTPITPAPAPIPQPEPEPAPAPVPQPEPEPEPIPQPTPDVSEESVPPADVGTDYVLNINPSSRKFHYPDCKSVAKMKESNKEYFTGTREEVIARGFSPCGNCDP